MDDAIAYVRDEVMPAVQAMDGCIGMSMLCDRDSGRCIATTAWETEEAMHDSEHGVHDMRRRYAELLGGTPEVQEWEIAVLHRKQQAPEGACCRVIWSMVRPEGVDDVIDAFRVTMLSRMDALPGCCGGGLLGSRETGGGVTAVVCESRDAMMRATDMARPMREKFSRQTGSEITEIAEFDL